jgi:hypothetical protein
MAQRPAKTSAELKALIKDGLQNCPDATTVRVFDAYRRCKKSQTGFALSTIWLKEIKDRIELSGLQSAKEKAGAREQLKVNLTWGVTGRRVPDRSPPRRCSHETYEHLREG